jgi:ribosome biogenesis GTPase
MNEPGLVVARHRRHVTVEDASGERHRCLTRGRSIKPLAGDEVDWRIAEDGTAVIEALRPRRSTLVRIDSAGRPEPVAANLSQLIAVVAQAPLPDWFLVDRYLAAAELMRIETAIVWNKIDLGSDVSDALTLYRRIGYRAFQASAKTRAGIAPLADIMTGRRSVLVGQSGVGKSSLMNALLGEHVQAVGELGAKGSHGRHTTTTAVLYRLDGGGELVDSPGVRQYAPHIEEDTALDRGFREFHPYMDRCRFTDCRHVAEPGCAVKEAVSSGHIAPRRHENYMKLLETVEALQRRARDGAS